MDNLVISLFASRTNGFIPFETILTCTVNSGAGPFTFAWDFGDGEKGTGEKISHTYLKSGTYQAEVTVEDIHGNRAVDTVEIVVKALSAGGLVAEYLFNGNADDTSGNKNQGIVNGPVLTEDRFKNANSAYYFDSEKDYIVIKSDPSLNPDRQLTITKSY